MKAKLKTEDRILEEATRIFAERGYQGTTVAAVCRAAQANIASVSYYFGSKDGLYEAAWENAARQAAHSERDPRDSPEQALRRFIDAMVRMAFDSGPGGCFVRIVRWDVEMPGEMMEKLRARFIRPRLLGLQEAVSRLMGISPEAPPARFAAGFIYGICAFFVVRTSFRQHLIGSRSPAPKEIEKLVEGMFEFALGGIRRLRERAGEGT